MNAKSISYWITTGLLAFPIGFGGMSQILHMPWNVEGTVHVLGYPAYVMTILGTWKVLGAIAILVPRYPRLKEWAYAGIFFDLTGAAWSHFSVGDIGAYCWHVVATLALAGLAVASWALRPESRIVGVLLPAKTTVDPKCQAREVGARPTSEKETETR